MGNPWTEDLHRYPLDNLVEYHVQQVGGELEYRQTMFELCTVMSMAGAEPSNYRSKKFRNSVSEMARELEIFTTIDGLIDGKATVSVLNLERH